MISLIGVYQHLSGSEAEVTAESLLAVCRDSEPRSSRELAPTQ
jgi:hypothetical protein